MGQDTRPRITGNGDFGDRTEIVDRTKNVLKSGELRAKRLTYEREQIPRKGGRQRKDKRYRNGGKRPGCLRSKGRVFESPRAYQLIDNI